MVIVSIDAKMDSCTFQPGESSDQMSWTQAGDEAGCWFLFFNILQSQQIGQTEMMQIQNLDVVLVQRGSQGLLAGFGMAGLNSTVLVCLPQADWKDDVGRWIVSKFFFPLNQF